MKNLIRILMIAIAIGQAHAGSFTTTTGAAQVNAVLAAPGPIGSVTPNTGAFTTMTTAGAAITGGTITGIAGSSSFNGGNITFTGVGQVTAFSGFNASGGSGSFKLGGVTFLDSTGIQGTNIGSTTPGTGTFTTLAATSVTGSGSVTSGGAVNAQSTLRLGGSNTLLMSATAPTIASGFGTGPSLSEINGTASFVITPGSGSPTSGVLTMPAAATGWHCIGQQYKNVASVLPIMVTTASTTTSVTLSSTTGGWTAQYLVMCSAY